jgi:uncharacterized protein
VIVDFHAHIFPPDVIANRDRYLASDRSFAWLYGKPEARLAGAKELVRSMDRAAIDVTVVQGFAWENAELCQRHNDYLLAVAGESGGRIKAFCTLQLTDPEAARREARRVSESGAAGLGELRPVAQGYDITGESGDALAAIAREVGLPVLFHVSEPVGHEYPGKHGLPMADFYRFVKKYPECSAIGAHWGGGLPLYGLMPELKGELANVWFDTAATQLLYDDRIYEQAAGVIGGERILFASDYPLLGQGKQLERVKLLELDEPVIDGIIGGNASQLLGL